MNQGLKKLMPVILAGTATLCSFISLIMLIVLEGEAWDYVNAIILLLSIGGLLAVAIVKMLNPMTNPAFFILPLGGVALANLIDGLHDLIEIGSSKYGKASYFSSFVISLLLIAVLVFFILSVKNQKAIHTAICLTYLAAPLFLSGLRGFNSALFSLFTDTQFKYGFNSFITASASFLFYITYAWLAHEKINGDY